MADLAHPPVLPWPPLVQHQEGDPLRHVGHRACHGLPPHLGQLPVHHDQQLPRVHATSSIPTTSVQLLTRIRATLPLPLSIETKHRAGPSLTKCPIHPPTRLHHPLPPKLPRVCLLSLPPILPPVLPSLRVLPSRDAAPREGARAVQRGDQPDHGERDQPGGEEEEEEPAQDGPPLPTLAMWEDLPEGEPHEGAPENAHGGEALSLHLEGLRMEVLEVGRVGTAHEETHRREALCVQNVREDLCKIGPPCFACEETHGVDIAGAFYIYLGCDI